MKKILSVLLCICMVLTLIPATVMASGTDKVYINGINFPMGDGSTTTYYKNGINGGTAGSENDWNAKLYNDNGTLTLVLKGFEYYGDQIGIYATEDLKIVLEGIENSITTESYGIWVKGDLEITGNDTCRIDIDAEGDYAIEANTQLYVDNKNPDEYATITINSVTEVQAKGGVGAISAEEAVVIIDSYIEPVGSDFGIKGGGYYQGQAKNITVKGKSDVYASGHTPFYSAPIVDGAFEWTDYYAGGWQDYTENTQYDEDWIDANYIQLRYNRNGGSNDGNEALEYYLVGMINNSDHYEKEYKFIDGKIEFKFTSDSYVAVMDSEGNTYRTDGWLDYDPTEATLKRSGDNKMHIRSKSDNRTLWLTVNDDGTLTLTTYEPIKTYTVTFDANGHGAAPGAISGVEESSKISAPTAPVADGYIFGGWYKEATCENAWDFDNDTVTADTTLYALWTPVIVAPTPADLPDTVNEKGPSKIWINNIKLDNGDYLATNDATEASENYTNGTPYVAVYKNGILYLNNINIENNANGESSGDEDHAIYWKAADNDDLIIELIEGTTNNISDGKWSAINGADGGGFYCPSLTIQGNGTLNVSCADNAIWVWDGTTIQNGATVNITCGGTGISNNDRSGKIVVKSGTTLNISGDDHAIQTDNRRIGTFYVEGGNITLKGNTSAVYSINCDFGNIPVYVSENVSGEGATLWDGTTDITTYKYISLSGTRTEVTPTYTVTFDANGGSVTPANATTGADGKLATLPTPTRSGSYTFKGWYTAASGGTQVTVDKVYTENTTIYAQWNYTGSTGGGGGVARYTIKFETNGGTKVANKMVSRNAKLTEPVTPVKDGYAFDGWYTDKELTTAYNFGAKVTKSFTLYAKWVEAKATHVCPSEKFNDLDTTKWYHEDIDYVLKNEIMLGTTDTVFAPEGSLTRGMLVTILYRSEGEPATNKSIPFSDVDMGAYYANAVIWAQQNGIVKGISETEYAPEKNVTREQLATIMFRYAQFKGMDAVTTEENLGFSDASDISDWAIAAMNWGVGRDYIFSRSEGYIAPKVAAARAEIAAFIHRYIVNTEK